VLVLIAKYLWLAGSVIIAVLGLLHLRGTFFSNMFATRNPKLQEEMKVSYPMISKDMSMWNAWISFNATHSVAAIFIGVINVYLSFKYFDLLLHDHFFFLITIAAMGFIVWLSIKYWFNTIRVGVVVVLACYVAAYGLICFK